MARNTNLRPASAVIGEGDTAGQSLTLTLDESWLQGRSWYGGIQLASALKATRLVADPDAQIRSLHGTFVAPVSHIEPAVAEASVLRAGRSVTHIRAEIHQGDRLCFEGTFILGAPRESEVTLNSAMTTGLSPENALKFPFIANQTPYFIQHYDVRWARGKPPFSGVNESTSTIFARPIAETTHYDEIEFLAITDVIPPAVISLMHKPSPASSMNCAIELIRPEVIAGTHQWIRFEVALHDSHSGYAWQTAHIYSESGQLLAVAHQAAAVFG